MEKRICLITKHLLAAALIPINIKWHQHENSTVTKSGLFSKTDKQDMLMKNTTEITNEQINHWKSFVTKHQTSPTETAKMKEQFCPLKHQLIQFKKKKKKRKWHTNER